MYYVHFNFLGYYVVAPYTNIRIFLSLDVFHSVIFVIILEYKVFNNMARDRFKTEAAYKKSLKHTASCNRARRELVKKHGKAYMKGKDASHTADGKAKAESSKTNQKRAKKGNGRLAKGKGTVTAKLNKKAGRPKKGSTTKSKKK